MKNTKKHNSILAPESNCHFHSISGWIRNFFPVSGSGIICFRFGSSSVVDPNTLNLDPDSGFWPSLVFDESILQFSNVFKIWRVGTRIRFDPELLPGSGSGTLKKSFSDHE